MLLESVKKLDKNKRFLVAVSGGGDSVALLDALTRLGYNIVVAHVNYKTREASDEEERNVRFMCKKHNIEVHVKVVDYYQKGNFEDFARVERYKFFMEVYKSSNCDAFLTAHHLDDNIETYLLQKKRKAIYRHYGIKESSYFNEMLIIRPLLNIRKKEINNYLKENNLKYSLDITNLDNKYARNKIRNEYLQNLSDEEFLTLVKELELKNKENDLIFKRVDEAYELTVKENKIDLIKFKDVPIELREYLIYKFLEKYLKRESKKLSYKYLQTISQNVVNDTLGTINSFNEYELVKRYNEALLIKKEEFEGYEFILEKNSKIVNEYFVVDTKGDPKCEIYAKDEDFPLIIRPYRPGDYIILKNGKKKVSRIFIDRKVPLDLRHKYPIVANKSGEIIFIPKFYKEISRYKLQSGLFMVQLIY